MWSHQDLNLGPPDYESGAANQLSYRTKQSLEIAAFKCAAKIKSFSQKKASAEKQIKSIWALSTYSAIPPATAVF
jgi:hypothetical protein